METETIYLRVSPRLKQWLLEQKQRTGKTMQAIIIKHLEKIQQYHTRKQKKPIDS